MPKNEIERKVFEILDVVEIDKGIVKERFPNELSGGQQQRVALAHALCKSQNHPYGRAAFQSGRKDKTETED